MSDAHDPVLGTRATRRPDPYGTQYEGHDIRLGGDSMDAVWAIGETPQKAIEAFCLARCGKPCEKIGESLGSEPGDDRWAWGYRFTVDGTGMKAAGILVPGGAVMTWWK